MLVFLLLRRRGADPQVRRAVGAMVVLLAAQGAVGGIQYALKLPAEIVWVHVALACATWLAVLWATAAAGRLVPRAAAQRAERVPWRRRGKAPSGPPDDRGRLATRGAPTARARRSRPPRTFLRAHRGQVAFVTVDIGANDVDGCATGGKVNVPCLNAGIASIKKNIPKISKRLRAAAGRGVTIVGMTLLRPVPRYLQLDPARTGLAQVSVALAKYGQPDHHRRSQEQRRDAGRRRVHGVPDHRHDAW